MMNEMVDGMIVRRVKVDRSRAPRQVLDATGRRQSVNPDVVKIMPRGKGKEVEVWFFKFGPYGTDEELAYEYALRGLEPADPYSLAAVNEADPDFADNHPNVTYWKEFRGGWCDIIFSRWRGERDVLVNRRVGCWDDEYWFAGLRK